MAFFPRPRDSAPNRVKKAMNCRKFRTFLSNFPRPQPLPIKEQMLCQPWGETTAPSGEDRAAPLSATIPPFEAPQKNGRDKRPAMFSQTFD